MSAGILGIALVLTVLGAVDALAFDGHRKGFVLGFGAGPGYLDFRQESENAFGVQTDLKLGFGQSDQVIIHYTGKQIWHSNVSTLYTEAMPMLGVTRYMKPEARSFFVTGAAGLGVLAFITGDESTGAEIGPAASLGAGYEFARHWGVEAGTAVTWSDDVTLYNVYLTFNVLGY